MTRVKLAFWPLALALACVSAPATADAKAEIQAVMDKLAKAFMSGNAEGIRALSTPDFTYRHANGMVEKGPSMIAQLKREFANGMKVTKWTSTIDSLSVKGNRAVVKGRTQSEMKMKGPDGKPHLFGSNAVSEDTLVKTPRGWKFKSVKMISDKMTMDGKPFDPTAMMGQPPQKPKK